MSIRKTLLLIVSVLAIAVASFAGFGFYQSFKNKQSLNFTLESSKVIDLLLSAANSWALERSYTNGALKSPSVVTPDIKETINNHRQEADGEYRIILQSIRDDSFKFHHKQQMISELQRYYDAIVAYRKQADTQMQLTIFQRDAKIVNGWFSVISDLIIKSQELRFAITEKTNLVDPELGRESMIKHFIWVMSEYNERQKAIISSILATNTPLDEEKIMYLSRYEGRTDTAWDTVQKLDVDSTEEVINSINEMRSTYTNTFIPIKRTVYEESINGDDYSISSQEWKTVSYALRDHFDQIQVLAKEESAAYTEKLIIAANTALLFNGSMLAIVLVITIGTFCVIKYRITQPIEDMTAVMHELADGNTDVELPPQKRDDEIGDMSKSLVVFKENAIERKRMREKEEEVRKQRRKEQERIIAEQEHRIMDEISDIINACGKGDFTQRMEVVGKEGLSLFLAKGMNEICDVTLSSITDVRHSISKLSDGDLDIKLSDQYQGVFDDIKNDFNETVDQLTTLIDGIQSSVSRVSKGDFTYKIDTSESKGFMLELGNGMNNVCQISNAGLSEVKESIIALSNGDLSKKIEGDYQGAFLEIKNAVNNTLSQLLATIDDVNDAVGKISHGDFTYQINTQDKRGFTFVLSEGVNSISSTLNEGISEVNKAIKELSEGNLNGRVEQNYEGQLDEMKVGINSTFEQLTDVIKLINKSVSQVSEGDFSMRIPTDNKNGFILELCEGINKINEISDQGISEVSRSINALSKGRLDVEVSGDYKGMFNELKLSVNTTLSRLDNIISEVKVAAVKVSEGDFTDRISEHNKEGFMLDLSQEMNNICEVSHNGLTDIKKSLHALAKGNLHCKINKEYQGMFNEIKESFNTTVDRLTEIVKNIHDAAFEVSRVSEEIAAGSTDLANRTERQASTLEETSVAIQGMTQMITENTDSSKTASSLSESASEFASMGQDIVGETISSINKINDSSQSISNIISMIDEIAFQTNLLALNAAVEAARAGEAGKGFAVVATEVRSLSGRSSDASKSIQNLIHESATLVKDGVDLVNRSGESLDNIVTSVQSLHELVSEILLHSNQQANRSSEINDAIDSIEEMTQQNAALVEQSAASAHKMNEQSIELLQLVSFFDLEEEEGSYGENDDTAFTANG